MLQSRRSQGGGAGTRAVDCLDPVLMHSSGAERASTRSSHLGNAVVEQFLRLGRREGPVLPRADPPESFSRDIHTA